MSDIFSKGVRGLEFRAWHKSGGDSSPTNAEIPFGDMSFALHYLRDLTADPHNRMTAPEPLSNVFLPSGQVREENLRELAAELISGNLKIFKKKAEKISFTPPSSLTKSKAKAPSPTPAKVKEPPPPPEVALPPPPPQPQQKAKGPAAVVPPTAAKAQAAVLKEAAKTGAPFCES